MINFGKRKLVMLPTDKETKIWLDEFNVLRFGNKSFFYESGCKWQHLYILSDEPIKEGDYCISNSNYLIKVNKIENDELSFIPLQKDVYCNSETWHKIKYYKKIIVSTNESLNYCNNCNGTGRIAEHEDCEECGGRGQWLKFPQLSQEFIKYCIIQYNKGNIITEVEVEYKWVSLNFKWWWKLIINSDNTINIRFPVECDWETLLIEFDESNYHNGAKEFIAFLQDKNLRVTK